MARAWIKGARAFVRGAFASVALTAMLVGGVAAVGQPAAATDRTVATAVVTGGSATAGGIADAGIVKTADLSKFQPGNVVSDAVFFSNSTMTEAQIQSFLDSKVSRCASGYTCLKDYYDTA